MPSWQRLSFVIMTSEGLSYSRPMLLIMQLVPSSHSTTMKEHSRLVPSSLVRWTTQRSIMKYVHDKELLTIVESLSAWHHYVFYVPTDEPLTILSDHNNLALYFTSFHSYANSSVGKSPSLNSTSVFFIVPDTLTARSMPSAAEANMLSVQMTPQQPCYLLHLLSCSCPCAQWTEACLIW
jgi:hypothetical protein